MANLEPQVQIKLIEISKEFAEGLIEKVKEDSKCEVYLRHFDAMYKGLVKVMSDEQI
jgi:hypothetical protein